MPEQSVIDSLHSQFYLKYLSSLIPSNTTTQAITGKMCVSLSNAGNIDHNQNPHSELCGTLVGTVECASFAEASKLCGMYIDEYGLGGGNWTGGQVYQNGILIARVSYNGRVWDMNNKEIILN